jgi:hypothetical protein
MIIWEYPVLVPGVGVLGNLGYRDQLARVFVAMTIPPHRGYPSLGPNQKPSSQRAVRSHLTCYIVPELGKVRLEQFGVENQQTFIARMTARATKKAYGQKTQTS